MRILIITDSYPPEVRSASHLMKEMADGLKEKGHEVFVVTSRPQFHAGERKNFLPVSIEGGIKVLRARVIPHHHVNFVLKGLSWVILPYIFFYHIKRHIKGKIDIAFVHSPPLPLTIAANLVKKFYGAKFCLNMQDFFPQNAIDLGVLKNKFLISFFEKMEKNAYENCDFIVTPSDGHKKFMVENRGVDPRKINVVHHWIDVLPFKKTKKTGRFRKLYGLENKFIFLFGGFFGPSQGLDIFIRIAERLKKHKDIIFLFVGEGSEKEKLVELSKSLALENILFKPLVSKEDYPELVKDADVGILSLTSANTTPAVPAKLMGYMVSGISVLAFLHKESDGIKIINEAECGLAAVSDDEENMARLTEKIYLEKEKLKTYGENGLKYVLKNFTKEVCLEKLEKAFESSKNIKKKVFVVFGTRPEAIKMAPVLKVLKEGHEFDVRVGVFLQQAGTLNQLIKIFGIEPNYEFLVSFSNKAIFSSGIPIHKKIKNFFKSLGELLRFSQILKKDHPDLLLVQGDTNTAMFAALIGFLRGVGVGHVEAGLRTYKWFSPFPEEINRRIISKVASIHFAPTKSARENLIREGVPEGKVFVTGNTEIDALQYILKRQEKDKNHRSEKELKDKYELVLDDRKKLILVTAHRRESFGDGIKNICMALGRLAESRGDVQIVYPVHPNPNVEKPVRSALQKYPNISLTGPMDYNDFVFLIKKSYLILTDSGGIQEATSILGKPVLIMRSVTERPEAVESGSAKLVGTNPDKIYDETMKLLNDKNEYSKMAKVHNAFGDGHAAEKIVEVVGNL